MRHLGRLAAEPAALLLILLAASVVGSALYLALSSITF
jgi:hypothetical protein